MEVQNNTRMKLFVSLAVLLLMMVGPCVGCTSGNVRLTNSSYGTLQICKNNEWRTVCSRDWGNLDAAVACRQLGYDGGYTQNTYASVIIPVDPFEYHCNGRESNLQDCEMQAVSRCSYGSYGTTIVCVRRNVSDPCNSGDIRLWGGESEYEGNIELCTDHGVWSVVSDSSWGNAAAVVACRQLGYSGSVAVPYRGSAFGRRLQPMEFGGLDCTGTESTLQECSVSSGFVRTWSKLFFSNQGDYSGVGCIPRSTATCKNGDVRLADGYSDNNGFAEICIDGIWTGICLDERSTSTVTLSHICNGLGYPRYTKIPQTFFTANRSHPQAYVYLNEFYCRIESSVLLDCVSRSSYGVQYRSPCTTNAILCCPNDMAKCCFQPRSPMDPTTPTQTTPTTSTDDHTTGEHTTPTQTTPTSTQTTPTIDDNTTGEDKAEFSLDFGTAATSLIMSSAGELRGLEEDIQNRVIDDISRQCNCSFCNSALKDGYFTFGESVTYHSKVLGVAGQPAINLVTMLKECIEDNPLIQCHKANIYLAATFNVR